MQGITRAAAAAAAASAAAVAAAADAARFSHRAIAAHVDDATFAVYDDARTLLPIAIESARITGEAQAG